MAPLPKRKHSNMRSGKRLASKKKSLPDLVVDKTTGELVLSHRKKA